MKEKSQLLIKPRTDSSIYQSVTIKSANWKYLNFEARKLKMNEKWEFNTEANEMVIVLLSGNYMFKSKKGDFETINGRKDVFKGVAHTLYVPRNTNFELIASSNVLDIAYGWCESDSDFPLKFVTPEETQTVIFGGDNATRQFNDLVTPGFGCS